MPLHAITSSSDRKDIEIAYAEFTSSVTVSGTSTATANDVVSAGAIVFDGVTRVRFEFFAPAVSTAVTNLARVVICLFDSTTCLADLSQVGQGDGTRAVETSLYLQRFLTPSAASHTYNIKAYRTVANATVGAGASGDDVFCAGYLRLTVADAV